MNDHFGWHPRTDPGVDEREGHVFVGNLLVADESFHKPLLLFEQTKSCAESSRYRRSRGSTTMFMCAAATPAVEACSYGVRSKAKTA